MQLMTEQVERGYRLLARPFVSLFKLLGFSPNAVTLIGLVLGVAVGYLIYIGERWPALAVYILMMILDHADGQLARITGKSSPFGAFFDGVADRLRIPVILVAVSAWLFRGDPDVLWLYLGFGVNAVVLLNAIVGQQVGQAEPDAGTKQRVRSGKSLDHGPRRLAVALMNLDLADWLNNSVLLILFLALNRLDLYLWVTLFAGGYAILMKIVRQYLLQRVLRGESA